MMKKQQKSGVMKNSRKKNMVFASFRIYSCFRLLQDHHDYMKSAISISCDISQPSCDNNFMFDQVCRSF